jgi:hypothetical protein
VDDKFVVPLRGEPMIRFLVVHYLAFAMAVMPVMCCCAPKSILTSQAAKAAPDQQAEKDCCCQTHELNGRDAGQHQLPTKHHPKKCPCGGGTKSFLGNLAKPEQESSQTGWILDTALKPNLSAPCLDLPWHLADVRLLQLDSLRLICPFWSALDLLRAESVLRC